MLQLIKVNYNIQNTKNILTNLKYFFRLAGIEPATI